MEAPDLIGKIELNESPDLTMAEITEQLFNNEFMSDIQFSIEGKVLYAHSWELMKRSAEFRNQLRTTEGQCKLIPIEDTSYDVFYQFIHFIYTDICEITVNNQIDLIKLARKYKVCKLESKLINESHISLKLFEYCVLEKYDIAHEVIGQELVDSNEIHKNDFVTLHPNVMEMVLKFDYMPNLKEVELFELLMSWINKSCEDNKIPLSQRRSYFDKLIRLIRFPAMKFEEFSDCFKNHVDLFTNQDILSIFKLISCGPDFLNSLWNSIPRSKKNELYKYSPVTSFKISKFSVSTTVILKGLRFGRSPNSGVIKIIARDPKTNVTDMKSFNINIEGLDKMSVLLNLGESIVLKPNIEYALEYDVMEGHPSINIPLRCNSTKVILSGPPEVIQHLNASAGLFEILYKVV